jgi:hypothetical protein
MRNLGYTILFVGTFVALSGVNQLRRDYSEFCNKSVTALTIPSENNLRDSRESRERLDAPLYSSLLGFAGLCTGGILYRRKEED